MATVKCSGANCGTELGPVDLLCPSCGRPRPRASPLSGRTRPPAPVGDDTQPASYQPVPPDPGEFPSGDRDDDPAACACGHRDNAPGSIICIACGTPLTASPQPGGATSRRYRLLAPWGALRLEGSETDIGRETGPFAEQLAGHPTVSRRHATLRVTSSGRLHVIDHNSSNGTFKNDRRIEANIPVELRDRDTVSFSTRLRLAVRIESERP